MPISQQLRYALAGIFPLTCLLATNFIFTAFAQRQTTPLAQFPLLDNATCSHNSSDGHNYADVGRAFERRDMMPIVNNQLRESSFHIRADEGAFTTLVCNIDPSDFGTLTLQMGIDDASSNREVKLTVEVLQSGTVVKNPPNLESGTIIDYVVDLQDSTFANPGSVAIKLSCDQEEKNYGCIVYFLDAELSPIGNYL